MALTPAASSKSPGAARLEQKCPPGRVLVSDPAAAVLGDAGLSCESHGSMPMKGLGDMPTFILSDESRLAQPVRKVALEVLAGGGQSPSADGHTARELKKWPDGLLCATAALRLPHRPQTARPLGKRPT